MTMQFKIWLLLAALMGSMVLGTGCVEEAEQDFQVIRASRDGTRSTIILVTKGFIQPETVELSISVSGASLLNIEPCCPDATDQSAETCPGEASPSEESCSILTDRQMGITAVQPGDITVTISVNGVRGRIYLADLRPETTAVVFIERDAEAIRLIAHRRITESFDDFDDNGQWIATEVR